MALQAMWVPGCAVVPEFIGTRGALDANVEGLVRARFDPSVSAIRSGRTGDIDGSELVGHLGGRGAAFRGQALKVNQFHFAIPTPVIRIPGNVPGPDPNRARIDKFFVMFDSQPGARLNQVFVSDGARGPIVSIPLDGISGAFGTNITWGAPPPAAACGSSPRPTAWGRRCSSGSPSACSCSSRATRTRTRSCSAAPAWGTPEPAVVHSYRRSRSLRPGRSVASRFSPISCCTSGEEPSRGVCRSVVLS